MDALSQLLSTVRMSGSFFSRAELAAPWGVSALGLRDSVFHVILEGAGWISVAGVDEPKPFRAGDLIVVPQGSAHVMRDGPQSKVTPLHTLERERGDDGLDVLRIPGPGPKTSILCGTFSLDEQGREFLLPLLPELILVAGGPSSPVAWLDVTLRQMADEQAAGRPGGDVAIARLADVLLVQVLRAWITEAQQGSGGWLGALSDPPLARALALIHEDPSRPWTAAELGRSVGMSRSALFARFTKVMGEAPSAYLTRWRMHLAQKRLREERVGLAQVASQVGYGSEAAFSRAFKRQIGQSPSAWRDKAKAEALLA